MSTAEQDGLVKTEARITWEMISSASLTSF